jgi:GR25 family glycosyltransferase involved in LPS biosynthesis
MENCNSIWLPSLTERYELIKTLEKSIRVPINIFSAIDGVKYRDRYLDYRHILSGQIINPGMIGCTLSHLELLRNLDSDYITIFEDDSTFHGDLAELNNFIRDAPEFDILCLGTSETVESKPVDSRYLQIFRFWGTHALIVKKRAALKILETFDNYSKNKIFLPADWLYSLAIKDNSLIAYAPKNNREFFDYKRGIYSVVAERVRY